MARGRPADAAARRPRRWSSASACRSSRSSLTFALLWYQRQVVRRTGSVAIRTDNVHYQVGPVAQRLGDRRAGARSVRRVSPAPMRCSASLIALWLLWGAWRASSEAIDQLMDREWPERERAARSSPQPTNIPSLPGFTTSARASSGTHHFVQFHVWVPADWTVQEAHDRLDRVEEAAAGALSRHRDPDPRRSRGPD